MRQTLTSPWLAMLAALAMTAPVRALDPARDVAQYLSDRWDAERGYPGGVVHAIAQSADGHLWIASESGLVRFDGLAFDLQVPPIGAAGTGPTVLGLAADADGGVWARARGPLLLRQHARTLTSLDLLGEAPTVVTALLRGRHGMLLTPLGRGVLEYRDGRLTSRVNQAQMPSSFVLAIAEAADGALWLGTRDAGLLRVHDGAVTHVGALPDPKVNALQLARTGEVWIATDRGVVRWTGTRIEPAPLPEALRDAPARTMTGDRDGNIWIGFGELGLVRVTEGGVATLVPWDPGNRGEVTALFEDRAGTLWVGTTRGVELLRDGVLTSFTTKQGVPGEGPGAIFAGTDGRVWFGPPSGGLFWLLHGRVHRVSDAALDADVVYSIDGRDGVVWVGRRRGGLSRVELHGDRARVVTYTMADGLPQDSVFAVHQARDGSVWAGTVSGGLSRYEGGHFTTVRTGNGLASNTIGTLLEAADGSLWVGTPSGVSIRTSNGWRTLDARHGLPANDVSALAQDRSGTVWVGTSAGLAYVEGDRVRRAAGAPRLATAILGLSQDALGGLWIATSDRVLQADPVGLKSPAAGAVTVREFGIADGLPAGDGVRRHRSMVADADGSIWVSRGRGLARVNDVGKMRRAATVATVDAVAGDDGAPLPSGRVVTVPAGTRRVTLTLGGANLTAPERVRFRYRLDGFDADWSAATATRQAVYTNLPPGAYAFRVMASDADGAWSGGEATLALRVAPAVWQTRWFQAIAALALVAGGWALYRARMRQVASRLAHVFEERLAERTRIAQDLHDTLLQGCLSASMQLHVAVDRLPPQEPARPALVGVQQLLARVIDEGRAALQGLRAAASSRDALEQALSRIPRELAPEHDAGFQVVVDGEPRSLHPIIRDEVYRIGREAIANALRHADADHIEVELMYAATHLRLSVRDDGRGIDQAVLRDGRPGHWGLEGMRERAQAIGAAFRVLSRHSAGTEVELVVPASIAFTDAAAASVNRWWPRRAAIARRDGEAQRRTRGDEHE